MKRILAFCSIAIFAAAAGKSTAGTAAQFTTIYQFGANNNIPGSEVTIGPAGQLFGTTYGGAYSDGAGSVYELAAQGNGAFAFKELYRFDSAYSPPNDGQNPYAGLTLSPDGTTLYGTTQNGGSNSLGITFGLNIAQAESNPAIQPKFGFNDSYYEVDTFSSSIGGGSRTTGSIQEDFVTAALFMFGTVHNGGEGGDFGALFLLDIDPDSGSNGIVVVVPMSPTMGTQPQGKLAIGSTSGALGHIQFKAQPQAGSGGFILSNLTVYGVANSGGANNYGTVYSVRADGSNFVVLHNFSFSTTNGANPQGGLILSGNTLFGTTSSGGSNYNGTVFRMNTDGSGFRILENFNYGTSGDSPEGDLILSPDGTTLYGTTYLGGVNGGGTVYSIGTNGSNFTLLHSFNSPTANASGYYTNSDGGWSVAGLALSKNVLYGTTPYGGTNGVGTVYAIALPGPPSLNVAPLGGGIKVMWPSSATNYMLQSNATLNSLTWSNATVFSDDGTNRSIVVTPAGGRAFFRLLSTNGL